MTMAEVTAGLVKELRDKTGSGMMDCKKALTETGGDIEQAKDWLRAKGLSKAANKVDRVAAEGLVAVALRNDGRGMTGAVIELNAETDFVARNGLFQTAALKTAAAALDAGGDVDAIAATKTTDGETIGDMITQLIATVGENMRLRRAGRVAVERGAVAAYVHNQVAPDVGRIGVLVAVEGEADQAKLQDLGKRIAMHVAATRPLSLTPEDLDPAAIERERAILTEQALESGRPANIAEKMVEGRIRKFLEEVVLLKQAFVMNNDQTVEQLVAETAKALGSPIKVAGFIRLSLGEGVEKPAEAEAA
jgi:elongation factor Ts